jgi:signal transduction histidine kinase
MEQITHSSNIIRGFEVRLFRYALIVGFIFRFIRIVHEYLTASSLLIILIGILNLALIILMFWVYRRYYLLALSIFCFQTLLTSVLTWNNSGGWNGSVPYVILMILVTIVITSHGVFQVVALSSYSVVIILFGYTDLLESFSGQNDQYSNLSQEVDFFVSTLILVVITLYLKNNFFSFRESLELNNEKLVESSQTLIHQNQKLQEQQTSLNTIRNNLEAITASKISEVRQKAETLKAYAFINAHHVRGPLARVLGLISLIELENPDQQKSDALKRIKREALEMDNIIGKITEVIS